MKRRNYYITAALCIFIIVIWILFHICSGLFKDDTNNSHLNTAYVAAGALFTAIAFLGTVFMFLYQHETEMKKTSLGIYQSIYSGMMNDPKFNDAFRYILRCINRKDKTILNRKTIAQLSKETVKLPQQKTAITRLNTITYFCDKMEYLGILISKDYLDISLFYNNGYNIICAYKVLEDWSFFEGGYKQKYIHFRYLVYLIDKEYKQYTKHCFKMEREIQRFNIKKETNKHQESHIY